MSGAEITTRPLDACTEAVSPDRRPLSVAHVIHSIARENGGPSETVPTLCTELAMRGNDVRLHVTRGRDEEVPHVDLQVHPINCGARRLGISVGMHNALSREGARADIVHSHGLWLVTNLDVYWATRGKRCRVVLSTRGMLEPYALGRNAIAKRIVWWLGQRAAASEAHCIHVTAESEYEAIRAAGLRNPVAVIPNGVHIPEASETKRTERRKLLFLSRIDPKKGVDILLQAWVRIQSQFQEWDLTIVGPGEPSYVSKMQSLCANLGCQRVTFAGPAYGTARDAAYTNADLFVLPTRSENFGMSVAEALAAGVPVICTRGAPWPRLQSEQCGRWIDIGVEPLATMLSQTMPLPRQVLDEMGQRGRAWMQREMSWQAQAERMEDVYRWLRGGAAPEVVQRD